MALYAHRNQLNVYRDNGSVALAKGTKENEPL